MLLTSHILGCALQGVPQQVLGSSCQASRSWRGMEGSRCLRSSGLSAPCQPQIDGGAFGASSRLDGWPIWRGSAEREMSHPSSLGIGTRPACSIAQKVGVFPSPRSALILFHRQGRDFLPNQCPEACTWRSPLIEAQHRTAPPSGASYSKAAKCPSGSRGRKGRCRFLGELST